MKSRKDKNINGSKNNKKKQSRDTRNKRSRRKKKSKVKRSENSSVSWKKNDKSEKSSKEDGQRRKPTMKMKIGKIMMVQVSGTQKMRHGKDASKKS